MPELPRSGEEVVIAQGKRQGDRQERSNFVIVKLPTSPKLYFSIWSYRLFIKPQPDKIFLLSISPVCEVKGSLESKLL